jgi:hypothetical protein
LNSRVERRSASVSINGNPPRVSGAGKLMTSWAQDECSVAITASAAPQKDIAILLVTCIKSTEPYKKY